MRLRWSIRTILNRGRGRVEKIQKNKKRVAFSGKCGKIMDGGIAQLGEHMHHTHGVAGSSPVVSIFSAVYAAEKLMNKGT